MAYGDLDVVYFAIGQVGLFPFVKIGNTSNLPRRATNLRRTARALFQTNDLDFFIIPGAGFELEREIHGRLGLYGLFGTVFGLTKPKTSQPYEHCGYTEWFHLDEKVEACMNEYGAIHLSDDFYFQRDVAPKLKVLTDQIAALKAIQAAL